MKRKENHDTQESQKSPRRTLNYRNQQSLICKVFHSSNHRQRSIKSISSPHNHKLSQRADLTRFHTQGALNFNFVRNSANLFTSTKMKTRSQLYIVRLVRDLVEVHVTLRFTSTQRNDRVEQVEPQTVCKVAQRAST